MTQPKTLSAGMIDRAIDAVRRQIDELRTMHPTPALLQRAEINGQLRMLQGLGLIDVGQEQALSAQADAAQEEGETA